MKENIFIVKNELDWSEMEKYLHFSSLSKNKKEREYRNGNPEITDESFPSKYRDICNQFAVAENNSFSQATIDRLNQIIIKCNSKLYKRRGINLYSIYNFFVNEFPVAIRNERKSMLWSLFLFAGFTLLGYFIIVYNPDFIYSVFDRDTVEEFQDMYEPSESGRIGESRNSNDDILMFGHYIFNNTSIGLRSFASGILFVILPIISNVYNALYLGVISGHLANEGYAAKTLYPFVITHGAFELTAIIISTGAGIRLGLSVLFPKRLTRINSLQKTVKSLMPIVIGFSIMFLIAAFIEAFWSSINMDASIKYTSGIICWSLVILYFLFAGRKSES